MSLEDALGYSFRDASLLKLALSHPSLGSKRSNQRLEFLGDSVLGASIARMLYDMYPAESEGELARRHSALVRSEALAEVARKINLGEYLRMAEGEAAGGGRSNPTNLEDACEALIGALCLDGGFETADRVVRELWKPLAKSYRTAPKDAKTSLQEWSQARGLPVPEYSVQDASGPAHAPQFTVRVSLPGIDPFEATASTKRAAEQQAAARMLEAVAKK